MRVTSGLSLTQCVEDIIHGFVALKVHFRYSANPLCNLNCFGNNCKLSQEEEDKENEHWPDLHDKQY